MITNTVGCRPVDLVFFDAETEEKFFGSYTDEDSEPLDGTLSLSDLNEEDHYDLMNWNREPTKAEIEKCRPHIDELVSTYKPHGIIYLGKVAESYKKYSPRLPQLDLYHPAFIARMEYKLLTVLREARKIDQFIERIENALERSV